MYIREHAKTLLARLNEPVSRLIIVTGPRQVGKTTLVRTVLAQGHSPSDYYYAALDEPTVQSPYDLLTDTAKSVARGIREHDVEWLTEQWERARQKADNSEQKRGYILVLDEIQKIPQWSEAVKGLWDADRAVNRKLHVILLGSAPLLMQKGLKESLAGRFELIRLTH